MFTDAGGDLMLANIDRPAATLQNELSEDDTSVKFITPATVNVGWHETTQIRAKCSFTRARIIVRGLQTNPEQLHMLKADIEKWSAVVKQSGARVD